MRQKTLSAPATAAVLHSRRSGVSATPAADARAPGSCPTPSVVPECGPREHGLAQLPRLARPRRSANGPSSRPRQEPEHGRPQPASRSRWSIARTAAVVSDVPSHVRFFNLGPDPATPVATVDPRVPGSRQRPRPLHVPVSSRAPGEVGRRGGRHAAPAPRRPGGSSSPSCQQGPDARRRRPSPPPRTAHRHHPRGHRRRSPPTTHPDPAFYTRSIARAVAAARRR